MASRTLPADTLASILTGPDCVKWINKFAGVRTKSETRSRLQLSKYDSDELIASTFSVRTDVDGYYMLVWRGTDDEVVLDVSGIIVGFTLPPVTNKIKFSSSRPQNTKQHVSLIGEGNAQFASAVSAVHRIFRFMGQGFSVGELRRNPFPMFSGLDTLCFETRFVTPSEHNVFSDAPLTEVVDPQNILKAFVDSGSFHYTDDNVVKCEELIVDRNAETMERVPMSSAIIRVGQLAEASVSFRAITAGQRKLFLTHLDSVLILNRTGTALIESYSDSKAKQAAVALASARTLAVKRTRVDDDLVGPISKKSKGDDGNPPDSSDGHGMDSTSG